jgi:hypothetical protein
MKDGRNLRFVFIQLLFSLAIGQVAIKFSDLIVNNFSFSTYHYIYLHLILCVVILSTSWVGFQLSRSAGNMEKINTIFSFQFLILIIDIALVIAYFIIVRGAEIGNYPKDGIPVIYPPNSNNEICWSIAIFGMFFIWDIITKLFDDNFNKQDNNKYGKERIFDFSELKKRGWQTLLCLCISIAIYLLFNNKEISPLKASFIDVILILLFLTFRSLKQDINREYKIDRSNAPDKLIAVMEKDADKAIVVESKYLTKYIIIKVLPLTLLITSILTLIIMLLFKCEI